MENLDPVRRGQLSRLVQDRRLELGWNRPQLVERALEAIAKHAAQDRIASPRERKLWQSLRLTVRHVKHLEECPGRPLATEVRRARLLAVCLALGLDRGQVNRLAGGV